MMGVLALAADRVFTESPITIANVSFSWDFDTATVTLSRDPGTKTSLQFDLYRGSETDARGGGGTLQNGQIIQLSGFRNDFDQYGGEGIYRINFAACPEEKHFGGSSIREDCGPIYTQTVQYTAATSPPSLVMCRFSVQGGKVCDFRSADECASLMGRVFSSSEECWASWSENPSVPPNPPTASLVMCRFSVQGGKVCDFRSADECASLMGRVFSSSEECWASWSENPSVPPNPTPPPAGYEEEVFTNIDAYRNPFPDTDMNQLQGKAAAELHRRAVIGGFPDGQFKGERPVNRAEAAKFLLLARFGAVEDAPNSGRFPDVLDGQWYTKFVVMAAQKGIIGGHPDGTFRPADKVNTAEFLKMLALTFDLPLNPMYRYSDVPADSWFARYAGIVQQYNLFPDRTTLLFPERKLSREEVAVAIYQYMVNR